MTLRNREDTGNISTSSILSSASSKEDWIALCGELALEEIVDLSKDRIRDDGFGGT